MKEREAAELRSSLEERGRALEEAQEALEERSRESDESVEKYCSLMLLVHSLEESNDSLAARLEHLTAATSQQQQANAASSVQPGNATGTPYRTLLLCYYGYYYRPCQ